MADSAGVAPSTNVCSASSAGHTSLIPKCIRIVSLALPSSRRRFHLLILSGVMGLLHLINPEVVGPDLSTSITAIIGGFGLIFASDSKKSAA